MPRVIHRTPNYRNTESIYLRLATSLDPLAKKMETSFAQFGTFLTELKLDHKDGTLPSERLTTLLFCI